ncbi:hypothetical protein [Segniliparus rotundus]|uniref:hypothetical protein n=1 Tax=Segniliparus rotundus TaxID=286802 RepID=UPI0002F34989|nr:hypothetical protein [Segniliparus rotundus]
MKILRNKSDDPAFKTMVDEILAGKKSLREAASSQAFNQGIADKAQAGFEWYRNLSEEERERGAEQGRSQLARLREELLYQPKEQPHSQEDGADDDDESSFDYSDPLRRNAKDEDFPTHSSLRHLEEADDEDEGFDPSDPLGRRR